MKIEEYEVKHNVKTDKDGVKHFPKVALTYCGICHEILPNGAEACPICDPEGFKKSQSPLGKVILECIECSRTTKLDFNKNMMPKGTVKIRSHCPYWNCPKHSFKESKKNPNHFFDKNGTEVVRQLRSKEREYKEAINAKGNN